MSNHCGYATLPAHMVNKAETIPAILNVVRHLQPQDQAGIIMCALAAEIAALEDEIRADMLNVVLRNIPYLVERNLAALAHIADIKRSKE
jgi:hypothetical protein